MSPAAALGHAGDALAGHRPAGVHQRILAAAEKEFALHGYDATTMRAAARRALVGLSLLVYYISVSVALVGGILFLLLIRRQDFVVSDDESATPPESAGAARQDLRPAVEPVVEVGHRDGGRHLLQPVAAGQHRRR